MRLQVADVATFPRPMAACVALPAAIDSTLPAGRGYPEPRVAKALPIQAQAHRDRRVEEVAAAPARLGIRHDPHRKNYAMKATEAKLLDFLKKSPQFVIPIYQRTYSWTEKECRQLWDDIVRSGGSDKIGVHFVGSIVYIES